MDRKRSREEPREFCLAFQEQVEGSGKKSGSPEIKFTINIRHTVFASVLRVQCWWITLFIPSATDFRYISTTTRLFTCPSALLAILHIFAFTDSEYNAKKTNSGKTPVGKIALTSTFLRSMSDLTLLRESFSWMYFLFSAAYVLMHDNCLTHIRRFQGWPCASIAAQAVWTPLLR